MRVACDVSPRAVTGASEHGGHEGTRRQETRSRRVSSPAANVRRCPGSQPHLREAAPPLVHTTRAGPKLLDGRVPFKDVLKLAGPTSGATVLQ